MDPTFWNLLPPTIVVGGTGLCLAGETLVPAVRHPAGRWSHAARNGVFWAIQIGINLGFASLLVGISQAVQARRWGLLPCLGLPRPLEVVGALLLIDLTTYWRHRASHRVPFLWRLHTLHHNDPELDVTTSLRTHPIEALLLVAFSCVQVAAVGAPVEALLVQNPLILGLSLFHHANWRVPPAVDRALRWVVVTPDMHKVHHAREPERTDSNFCILFSFWDRLFGTWVDPDRERDVSFGLDPGSPAAEATLAGMWWTAFPALNRLRRRPRVEPPPSGAARGR
jgi:sterol desaturase/sphingolipid hydroxylase (fatty acid hydroxylase superfamily)